MYLNMLSSNCAFFPIDQHTRVIGKSRSIIDHVITNDISNIIFPCVFLSDIRDHFPIAIIVKCKNKNKIKLDAIRNFTFLEIKKNLIVIALLINCNYL